jgi:hypothetical protein
MPTYTEAAAAPEQLKEQGKAAPSLPPAAPKQLPKPEVEAQTVIRTRSGKVIPRVEQLVEPSFSVDDLYDSEPEIEVPDYESIHEELEKGIKNSHQTERRVVS